MPLLFVMCGSAFDSLLSGGYRVVGSFGIYEAVHCGLKQVLDKEWTISV